MGEDDELERLAEDAAAVARRLRQLASNGQVHGAARTFTVYSHPTHHGPTGDWGNVVLFKQQVARAIVDLRREQMRISHLAVAERCGRSVKALNFALDWHQLPRWPWPPLWAANPETWADSGS